MKIEDQVLSIEQMQHLKKLSVKVKDTALCIIPRESGHKCYVPTEVVFPQDEDIKIPTLTLQEILEMLPKKIEINSREYYLFINYQDGEVSYAISEDEMFFTIMFEDTWPNTLQGAYNMLCWTAENGYLNK